jgi:hypothetical protein
MFFNYEKIFFFIETNTHFIVPADFTAVFTAKWVLGHVCCNETITA